MNKRVLVVDDDESIVDALSMLLTEMGFTVEATTEAEETFTKAQTFHPDIILLDALLSGFDGRAICQQLKHNEHTHTVPVIIISAHPGVRDTISHCGADGFLPKPFDANHLIKKIQSVVK